MAESAKHRLQAISSQLSSPLPPIVKVAPESNTPRVAGKVIIITGTTHPALTTPFYI